MIIISQDKETIVNFENIIAVKVVEYVEADFDVVAIYSGSAVYTTLGSYPTKDRAMDVLQSIAKARGVNMYEYKMPKK